MNLHFYNKYSNSDEYLINNKCVIFLPLRPVNNGDGSDPKWGGRNIGLDIAGSDTGLNPFLLTKH